MTVRGKTDCTQSGRHSGILQALLEEPSVLFELDLFHPSSRKRVRTTDNLLQPNSTCVVEALEESPRPAKRSLRPLTQNLRVSWAVVPSTLYTTNHEDFLDLFSPTTFWAWHPRRAPWRLDYILQSLHTDQMLCVFKNTNSEGARPIVFRWSCGLEHTGCARRQKKEFTLSEIKPWRLAGEE